MLRFLCGILKGDTGVDLFSLTFDNLCELMSEAYGRGAYHARALYREILKNGNDLWHQAPEFAPSQSLSARIKKDLRLTIPDITRTVREGGTIKFLCRFDDGLESESVVIPMKNHATLCVSSQIGCRMGCRFCETGHMGFRRNLSPSEIVGQVYAARFVLNRNIKNLVFMGMGEPFDNYDAVRQAILVLGDQRGFDFAPRHVTVSTVGLTGGIRRLAADKDLRVNLAISLNASNDEIRSRLMPVNRRHSMAELKQALLDYPLNSRGLFLLEYVLIEGMNDSQDHAAQLADFIQPLPVRVNLIPLNKTSGFPHAPTPDDDVHRFAAYLEGRGICVVKRWSKGSALAAGCGQLGSKRNQGRTPF